MSSDLEASLIDGGIPAAAAKILSNAIGNAATGRTSYGRQYVDGTPVQKMRMIDADTRRYQLTNLDYPAEQSFRSRVQSDAGQYKSPRSPHPYTDSQPATPAATLATDAVSGGKYISTARKTTDGVAQAEVSLDIIDRGGTHPRLNKSTGKIEAVPLFVDVAPKDRIEASVREDAGRTVITIRLK